METLDALSFSVFPPPPPPPLSSSTASLWDAGLWGATGPAWVDDGWTLDGLPDVKPDVSELLQASLRQDLPVLNADSTTFLLDSDAAPTAWMPQWSYCAYCAAGGGAGAATCGAPLPQPQPPQGPSQLYPDQGGGYMVDPYLGALAAPIPTSFAEGLVFVDSPAPLSTVPEDACLEEAVRWAAAVPPALSPLPMELGALRTPLPEPSGELHERFCIRATARLGRRVVLGCLRTT